MGYDDGHILRVSSPGQDVFLPPVLSCYMYEVMHISMVLLLMFLSPPLRGAGPMALMLGHEWQHIYICMRLPPSSRTCLDSLVLFCLVVSFCFDFLFYVYKLIFLIYASAGVPG
jgi:hypothetical protein